MHKLKLCRGRRQEPTASRPSGQGRQKFADSNKPGNQIVVVMVSNGLQNGVLGDSVGLLRLNEISRG